MPMLLYERYETNSSHNIYVQVLIALREEGSAKHPSCQSE